MDELNKQMEQKPDKEKLDKSMNKQIDKALDKAFGKDANDNDKNDSDDGGFVVVKFLLKQFFNINFSIMLNVTILQTLFNMHLSCESDN